MVNHGIVLLMREGIRHNSDEHGVMSEVWRVSSVDDGLACIYCERGGLLVPTVRSRDGMDDRMEDVQELVLQVEL